MVERLGMSRKGIKNKKGDIARFMDRVNKTDFCWLWTGPRYTKGYGAFWLDGSVMHASRAAYKLFVGPVDRGILVCHTCDNPPCVNPDHLFLGTAVQNTQDAVTKGRFRYIPSKLGGDRIAAIQADRRLQREIAKDYGITQSGVSRIKSRVVVEGVK